MTYHTCTNTIPAPEKTVEEMMKALDDALAAPRLIGSVMGMTVYIDGKLPDRMVEIRSGRQIVRFRADHPYLDGTKFADDVRRR